MLKSKGVTLIELMIVVAIIAIAAAAIVPHLSGLSVPIEDSMRTYVRTLYHPTGDISVMCKQYDTDGDGNRRCTATYTDGRDQLQTVVAECDYSGACAPPKATTGWR